MNESHNASKKKKIKKSPFLKGDVSESEQGDLISWPPATSLIMGGYHPKHY
jgi:hypothetical protein